MDVSIFPLGLDEIKITDQEEINNEMPAPVRKLLGYSLEYRVSCLGKIAATRIFKISDWKGNQPDNFIYNGIRFGLDSDIAWNAEIVSPGTGTESPVIQFVDGDTGKGFVIFARLFHADVLPGLEMDDVIRIRPFCQGITINIYEEKAEKEKNKVMGLLMPEDLAAGEKTDETRMRVYIYGEIISVQWHEQINASKPLPIITVKTPLGLLPIICSQEILSEQQKIMLKKGNSIGVIGWLFGDAAAGEYAKGVVFDREHDLRLLKFCAEKYDFSRARQIFSDECQYYRGDELRATGPEAIVKTLNDTAKLTIEKKYRPAIVYGQIFLKRKSDILEQHEKCLAFMDSEGVADFLMCVRVDETGRISRLFTVCNREDVAKIQITSNFQEWREGLSHASARQEKDEGQKKQTRYFETPEAAALLHGDAEAFFGEPFFGFGDLLDILFPGEDDENMQKVMQWITDGENAGHYQLDKFTGVYLDYPEKDALLGLQYALGKEDEETTFKVLYFYPFMQGCDQSVEIVATFDWPDKVCGYVAIVWRDKVPLNLFAQSYRLWNDKIIFGQHIQFAFSGMALQIERAPFSQFSVHEGQFYEMNLAQFLYENPGQTAADFEAPVIHMENSVILVPRDITGLYEIQVPVKQVESVKFDNRKFTRLLVPIVRDWDNDEELLAWIYVGEKEMGDYRPVPGDIVQGVIMLCGAPVDAQIQ